MSLVRDLDPITTRVNRVAGALTRATIKPGVVTGRGLDMLADQLDQASTQIRELRTNRFPFKSEVGC